MRGHRESLTDRRIEPERSPRDGCEVQNAAGAHSLSGADWICAAATAALIVFSFPSPFGSGLWILAWGAWIPMLARLALRAPRGALERSKLTARQALWLGLLIALLVISGSFSWLAFPIIHYGGVPAPLAYLLLLIPAFVLAIFFATFLWLVSWSLARWGRAALFVAPIFWVAIEWARYHLTRHGWNWLGYSQASVPEVIHLARYTGVLGVSFVLLLASAASAFAVSWSGDTRSMSPMARVSRRILLAIAMPLVLLGLVFGSGRALRSSDGGGGPSLDVFAVQPVIPIFGGGGQLRAPDIGESVMRHVRFSEQVLSEAPGEESGGDPKDEGRAPRLLIWPESPMNISLDEDEGLAAFVADFAREHGVYLLLNHLGRTERGWHNSAAVISPRGERLADYHKMRLLEFGEYVPGRRVLPFLKKIPALAGDFVPGQTPLVVSVGPARLGPFICFESAFPEIPRALVRRGATILINISNDGWFGTTAGATQHLSHAIVRAVETGRPLVRVTNSGITALIHPDGTVHEATPLFQPAVRRWRVRCGSTALTPYVRFGDLLAWTCVAVSAGVIAWGSLQRASSPHGVSARSFDRPG